MRGKDDADVERVGDRRQQRFQRVALATAIGRGREGFRRDPSRAARGRFGFSSPWSSPARDSTDSYERLDGLVRNSSRRLLVLVVFSGGTLAAALLMALPVEREAAGEPAAST
jgi:hypothetical protein